MPTITERDESAGEAGGRDESGDEDYDEDDGIAFRVFCDKSDATLTLGGGWVTVPVAACVCVHWLPSGHIAAACVG